MATITWKYMNKNSVVEPLKGASAYLVVSIYPRNIFENMSGMCF